jgi:hypothetical protein
VFHAVSHKTVLRPIPIARFDAALVFNQFCPGNIEVICQPIGDRNIPLMGAATPILTIVMLQTFPEYSLLRPVSLAMVQLPG